jgi:hypothetical protein
VRVTNPAGAAVSVSAAVAVASSSNAGAPFVSGVVGQERLLSAGASVSLIAPVTGDGLTYQWFRNGVAIAAATSASYLVAGTSPGVYAVRVSNNAGTVTAPVATLASYNSGPSLPLPPRERVVLPGSSFLLTAAGTAGSTYQWFRNGIPLSGETNSTLLETEPGDYAVRVTEGASVSISAPVPVSTGRDASRLINASCRSQVAEGATLIPGFVITGSGRKTVLIRAVGPALTAFGAGGTMLDPQLRLFKDNALLATNDNWETSQIGDAFSRTGAFPLPTGSKDAALLATLDAPGSYTVHVNGANGTGGVVLVEIYDADADGSSSNARLANVSVRSQTAAGDATLTLGCVVSGRGFLPVLVRGAGPALAGFGVPNVLANPRLELFADGGRTLLLNDDWGAFPFTEAMERQRALIGAFRFSTGSRDASAVMALMSGAYTLQINGSPAGQVLAEIYATP